MLPPVPDTQRSSHTDTLAVTSRTVESLVPPSCPVDMCISDIEQHVSPQRARELFAMIASRPDIPHHFIDDGCHFRAHVAAWLLEQEGVYCEKVVSTAEHGDLRIDSSRSPLGFTLAMFHNAVALLVDTDNGLQRWVLDPSLCDGPVPVDTWAANMSSTMGAPCTVSTMPRFCLMPPPLSQSKEETKKWQAPQTWDEEDLAEARAWNDQYAQVQQYMQKTGFYEHLQELVANPPDSDGDDRS